MSKHLTSVFIFLAIAISASASAQKANDQQAKIEMLKAFYTEYIIANSKAKIDDQEIAAIKKKYCTAKFLKELETAEDPDYEIFLSAQDCDIEWLKTLHIEPAATFNVFRVTYDMGFEDEKALIRPVVAKESGKFKIDGIKND